MIGDAATRHCIICNHPTVHIEGNYKGCIMITGEYFHEPKQSVQNSLKKLSDEFRHHISNEIDKDELVIRNTATEYLSSETGLELLSPPM